MVRQCVDTDLPGLLETVRAKLHWCDRIPEHNLDLRVIGQGVRAPIRCTEELLQGSDAWVKSYRSLHVSNV